MYLEEKQFYKNTNLNCQNCRLLKSIEKIMMTIMTHKKNYFSHIKKKAWLLFNFPCIIIKLD